MHVAIPKLIIIILIFIIFIRDISFAELLDVVVVFINIVVVDDPSVIDVVASSVVILDSVVDTEPQYWIIRHNESTKKTNVLENDCFIFLYVRMSGFV